VKCILHIGTEKTGTTSLQEFFHRNRARLAELGYVYPQSLGLRNHRALPTAAYGPQRRDDFTQRQGITTDPDLRTYQAQVRHQLQQELAPYPSRHTVIFSSEQLQSCLRTPADLDRLRRFLHGLDLEPTEVVVYLRHPVELANSLYSTAVFFGSTIAYPPGPENEYYHNLCHHQGTLTRFSQVFGPEVLRPRLYNRAELVNGSVIDDFAAAVGLPCFPDGFTIPPPQNQSITALGLELLRRVNQILPLVFTAGAQPRHEELPTLLATYLNQGPRYGLSLERRRQYEMAFQASNDWVRAHYFPHRSRLFDEPHIPPPAPSALTPAELDQLAHLLVALWQDSAPPSTLAASSRSILRRIKARLRRLVKGAG